MTRAVALLLAALSACGGGGSGADGGDGDGDGDGDAGSGADAEPGPVAQIHRIGRFDGDDRFAWPGSALATRFDGTAISIRLDEGGANQYDVTVDGAVQPVLVTIGGGAQDYELASGLAPGEHDLLIARRTEGSFGITGFAGFPGATLVDSEGSARWIELVGDSITCGYGVLGDSATCSFSADTEAETHAWGALAAAELGAFHTAIAYSGKGVYQNYGGEPGLTMRDLFPRTFPDAEDAWPFTAYVPDVVVINLGTNDFSDGDPGAPFVDAYVDFIGEIRVRYPAVPVVVALSPMLSDGFPSGAMHRTIAAGYLQEVVATAGGATSYLVLDEQVFDDGLGCDYHPGEVTQQKMADALVAHLRPLMGW
jgi:lysophospholipase L1-like esterase